MIVAAWFAIVAGVSATEAPAAGVERIALVIARNDGGTDRPQLRFAHTDAQAFADVLTDIGGVAPDALALLREPDRAQLMTALGVLEQRARATGGRAEIIVYYSGHSDAEGLILGAERVPYGDLKQAIARVPADVRVIVLDSCASGAYVQLKGGVRRPALLMEDAALDVKGTAVLTSSSADEAAQESDRLRGSFFTYALVTGLRGAADASGDGRVTLTEAYQYAFSDTLQRTERTSGGPQHAAFDIRLSGTGDYVLSDLRDTTSSLVLGPDVVGRVFVRNARGHLVAELRKRAGDKLALAVGAGRYDVVVQSTTYRRAQIEVGAGAPATVTASALVDVDVEATTARGATLIGARAAPLRPPNAALFLAGTSAVAIGTVSAIGLGAYGLMLNTEARDPDGDASQKQLALDAGPWIVAGTIAAVVVGAAGGAALVLSSPSSLE